MKPFASEKVKLKGVNLIEASAGTGKTYALAELYLRLVTEEDIAINQILVVTYTRAATEELRDRLRRRLVKKRDGVLVQTDPTEQKLLIRLNRAIQSFDEAAIFTIHGFCQRALTDYTFESGASFDLALSADDDELLQAVADDFWRKKVATADSDFISFLIAENESIDKLLQAVKSLVGKPYLNVLQPEVKESIDDIRQQAGTQFEHVKHLWQISHDDVRDVLKNRSLLNGNQYRASSVSNWLSEMDRLMAMSALPGALFAGFERFTQAKLQGALKKNQQLPPLEFFDACELLLANYQKLQQTRKIQLQQLRFQLFNYICQALPQKKQEKRRFSYDDLLVNLCNALNKESGGRLASRLKSQYKAVLIDEFQDTDPIQYEVFSKLFFLSGMTTFLVGDPKQAIYSFRGADIFTYLRAKNKIQPGLKHTLNCNQRAHPDLVTAINTLFSQLATPFVYRDIAFHHVDPARKKQPVLEVDDRDNTSLQFIDIGGDLKASKKEIVEAAAAEATADEIADLLHCASAAKASLYNEQSRQKHPLTGGDIAVLVRYHYQANMVGKSLHTRGINSVQQSRENVFLSPQARVLKQVLSAVAEPGNRGKVLLALTTNLYQFNAGELFELRQNEQKWAEQLTHFYALHQIWLKHGFMRLFRQLLVSLSVQKRLLAFPDGERQITNLLHLAELIQDDCNRNGEDMQRVLQWLSNEIQAADGNDNDDVQLRLESDEQLVKIMTIHKSKGLQYPIVFCPFLWSAGPQSATAKVIRFHREADHAASVAFAEPDLEAARISAAEAQRAEERRLLYVALTRARERCIVIWSKAKDTSQSALFSLLMPSSEVDSDATTELSALIKRSEGTISWRRAVTCKNTHYQQTIEDEQQPALSARQFHGEIKKPWRIGSFSTLTYDYQAANDDKNTIHERAIDDAELPDYDLAVVNEPDDSLGDLDRFTFPRGVKSGQCLHTLLELWDFTSEDDAAWQNLVSRILGQYGFEHKWVAVVCQWLKEVVATPLNQHGPALADIASAKRVPELAFYFPVAFLSLSHLKARLLPLLATDSLLAITLNRLRFADLTGFIKGFIDLVFEHQGKFYLVDYKSNYLGSSNIDYHNKQLANAMVAHNYPLQYLVYSLALHLYLKLRMKDYNPAQHLGGVYYLFIRGMKPQWEQAGIFYDAPNIKLLHALDNCLKAPSDD